MRVGGGSSVGPTFARILTIARAFEGMAPEGPDAPCASETPVANLQTLDSPARVRPTPSVQKEGELRNFASTRQPRRWPIMDG